MQVNRDLRRIEVNGARSNGTATHENGKSQAQEDEVQAEKSPDTVKVEANASKKTNVESKKDPDDNHIRIDVLDSHGLPDVERLKHHFLREGLLTEDCAISLINSVSAKLFKEQNLIRVSGPTVIVGDLFGQYYDLINIFESCTSSESDPELGGQFLFLGNYVNMSDFSCEVLLYLLALKLRYPEKVHLLRGNQECGKMAAKHGFMRECAEVKYSGAVYDAAVNLFHSLPVAAVLDDKYFCVHAGLGPELRTLSDINHNVYRCRDIPFSGPLSDLLYSCPSQDFTWTKPEAKEDFEPLSKARCGHSFGQRAVSTFLAANNLEGMIRSHALIETGFNLNCCRGDSFLLEICSAPNFGRLAENYGAVLVYKGDRSFVVQQFVSAAEYPVIWSDSESIIEAASIHLSDMADWLLRGFRLYIEFKLTVYERMRYGCSDPYDIFGIEELNCLKPPASGGIGSKMARCLKSMVGVTSAPPPAPVLDRVDMKKFPSDYFQAKVGEVPVFQDKNYASILRDISATKELYLLTQFQAATLHMGNGFDPTGEMPWSMYTNETNAVDLEPVKAVDCLHLDCDDDDQACGGDGSSAARKLSENDNKGFVPDSLSLEGMNANNCSGKDQGKSF